MPPLSFCYHRCYSTEPSSFRRTIQIYAGSPEVVEQIAPVHTRHHAGIIDGTCSIVDDMYYCGATTIKCEDSCGIENKGNGICEDHPGGPCLLGTDCSDCGARHISCEQCDYEF